MVKLKIIDLDVWGNSEEGYEINNFIPIGTLEFHNAKEPFDISKNKLKKVLVSAGFIKKTFKNKIELDDCSSMSYFYQVLEKKTYKPIYNIEVDND